MENFTFYSPTRIVFGQGMIAELARLLGADQRVLMTYGGGSIKRNGVYEQVHEALAGRTVFEFGGIEPNPRYETLMKAVELAQAEAIDFLLAVGGGSVLDGTKFVAAALRFEGGDPWDILVEGAPVAAAVPVGSVLTLPAAGSESNPNAVVSRASTQEKRAFASEHVIPRFAILDPATTATLPERQTQNGIIDAYVHVMEQYLTYPCDAPLQDRQAEALLLTLIEEGPKVLAAPDDYNARANVMWCATQALNTLIGCGVPQDWSTHMIGHELTALYGIDHGRTLAVVLPAMMRHQRTQKRAKILQYGARVWGLTDGPEDERIETAIERTEAFFRGLGVGTRLCEYDAVQGLERIPERLRARGAVLGERKDIGPDEAAAILALCTNL